MAMEIGSKARAGMHVARKSVHGFVVRAVAEAKSTAWEPMYATVNVSFYCVLPN